jgi:hypothetical protein
MANRAYLYTCNRERTLLRDVSENRNDVPLVYQILLGTNTEMLPSKLWEYEYPIALQADFKSGLQRLYDFYDFLLTQKAIDASLITKYKKDTQDFFVEHPDRVLDCFYMEGGEAYDMISSENYPIEKENEYQCLKSRAIAFDIQTILAAKPENIFDLSEQYDWLAEVQKDLAVLEPYWTYVTYFSFNKTGQ